MREMVGPPEIASRGFVYEKEAGDLMSGAAERLLSSLRETNRVGKRGVIGEQHRLACRIMFGLAQKVSRNPFRIIGRISNNDNFGRPGHHVDPDLAIKLALCLCHKGIARAGDNIDRRNAFTAMCQRGNRLCAAKPPNLIDAGKMRGGQVISVTDKNAVIQVFEETRGLDLATASVSLVEDVARLGVSKEMVGRRFDGRGAFAHPRHHPTRYGPAQAGFHVSRPSYRHENILAQPVKLSRLRMCKHGRGLFTQRETPPGYLKIRSFLSGNLIYRAGLRRMAT
jgi:hypothetical protein